MKRYSPSDIEFIRDNHQRMTYSEIATVLGREENSIRQFCHKLRHNNEIESKHTETLTSEEEDFIKKNFDSMTWAQLGKAISKKGSVVCHYAKKIGLKKSKENFYNGRVNDDHFKDPSMEMAKASLALGSKLKVSDIPDELAEIQILKIKLKRELQTKQNAGF